MQELADRQVVTPKNRPAGGEAPPLCHQHRIAVGKDPYIAGKSSLGRRGLIIETAAGLLPGFSSCLALERGEVPIALLPGMRICQIFLYHVSESHRAKS